MSTVETGPEIGALAPWFGAKRTLAPEIVRELGQHRVYWEPFCGSCAVLLAKPPVTLETINDLHGDLVNLARTIQHPTEGPRLYRRLRRTLASEELFRDAAAGLEGESGESPDVERAYRYFVASWLGRNGIAGTNVGQKRGAAHSFCVRYTAGGGQPAKRFASAIASIPAWRDRLRNVVVLRKDAIEVLGKIEDATGAAIYADPPYLAATRSGWNGSGGQSRYLHEFGANDHLLLARALNRFQHARVVVSYYDHPELAELYPGWRKRAIEANKAIANQSKRDDKGATKAPEVLLVNERERLLF